MDRTSAIVSFGQSRAIKGAAKDVEELARKHWQQLERQYAAQLAGGGVVRRWFLRLKIRREVKKQIRKYIKRIAPPDGLY